MGVDRRPSPLAAGAAARLLRRHRSALPAKALPWPDHAQAWGGGPINTDQE